MIIELGLWLLQQITGMEGAGNRTQKSLKYKAQYIFLWIILEITSLIAGNLILM